MVPTPSTNVPLPCRRGEDTFLPGWGSTRYKCEAFVPGISPGTNAPPHLYQFNTRYKWGYEPVQMSIFLVVNEDNIK
jgi:hypothetical protein